MNITVQRSSVWPLLVLLLITILGGALRFYHLAYPPLWNDEIVVYWRVCGTYGQMLVPLRHDMFPPLHYSLYWLINHYHTLTPWVFRLVPAIAGMLSIPAMETRPQRRIHHPHLLGLARTLAMGAARIRSQKVRMMNDECRMRLRSGRPEEFGK